MDRQIEGTLLHPRELKQENVFKVSFISKTHLLFALEACMVLSFLITNALRLQYHRKLGRTQTKANFSDSTPYMN